MCLAIMIFQTAKRKGADQTVWMPRLVCSFVVDMQQKSGFLVTIVLYKIDKHKIRKFW